MLSKVYKKKARLREDVPKRFDKTELQKRVKFLLDKEVCQVCEVSHSLDYPHHVEQGLGVKDDTTLINICTSCHRAIHTQGYDAVNKTRKECLEISYNNNSEYTKTKGEV